MKKIILLLSSCLFIFSASYGQTATKYVLFEHFTNTCCGPCAQQNPIFQENILKDNFGTKIFHIAFHPWWPCDTDPMYQYNIPEISYRTTYYGVSGVPTMYMMGNAWEGSPAYVTQTQIDDEMEGGSPIAVHVSVEENGQDRDVTINVETVGSNPPDGSNLVLHTAVIEYELNYTFPPGTNGETYFPNVFRQFLSGTDGEAYSAAAKGSSVEYNYTFTMDPEWQDEMIYIVAYVQDTVTKEVFNAGSDVIPAVSIEMDSKFQDAGAGVYNFIGGKLKNTSNANKSFRVTIESDAPSGWSYSINADGTEFSDSADISVSGNSTTNLDIKVKPGNTPAIAEFIISVKEINSNSIINIPVSEKVYIAQSVRDLVVSWDQWESTYENELGQGSANSTIVSTSKDIYLSGINNDQLRELQNIYLNVGWSFPSLTDGLVAEFTEFLNNGGNIFIAGQDIGWDTWEASGNGTANTRSFYSTYLKADYISDLSTGANQMMPVASDNIYGSINTSSLSDVYSGNYYPDEIEAVSGSNGEVAFVYDNGNGAGIKVDSTYKSIYLGVGLEMVADANVRSEILQATEKWFNCDLVTNISVTHASASGDNDASITLDITGGSGSYSVDWSHGESSETVSGLSEGVYTATVTDQSSGCEAVYKTQIFAPKTTGFTALRSENSTFFYPNPVSHQLKIETKNKSDELEILIYNIEGKVVRNVFLSNSNQTVDVSSLKEGVYAIRVVNNTGAVTSGRFVKLK